MKIKKNAVSTLILESIQIQLFDINKSKKIDSA
jgi:hypothetical protein